MITETSTKNQHYVPQFLLKKFSLDRKTIKVYQKDKGRIIENAPIKNQCSKKWFYGKGKTEDKLSQLEGDGAKVIKRVLEDKKVDFKEKAQLYQFIYLQSIRTLKKINLINETTKEVKKKILRSMAEIEGLKDIDEIISEIVEQDSMMAPEELVKKSEVDYKRILDLDFVILKIENLEKIKQNEFIIGDSPVVHYNYYFQRFNGGLERYGEMIIMPLSPYETIILYDKNIYDFYNINKNKVIYIGIEDIQKLNSLQYINCDRNIYFKTTLDEQTDCFKMLKIEKKPRVSNSSEIIGMNLDDLEFIDVGLSFFAITKYGIDLKEACIQQIKTFLEMDKSNNFSENYIPKFTSPLFRTSPKSVADIREEIFKIKTGQIKATYYPVNGKP